MADDPIQALVFGEVAETYHAARPRYPQQMVEDVVAYASIPTGSKAVDVGAGTGIATELFAAAGLVVTAIEPSGEMAAIAQRELPDSVRVVVSSFEEWETDESFDLVYAAQSWHWVDAEAGFRKARDVLRPGGIIALMWNLWDEDQPDRPAELDAVYAGFAEELGRSAKPARLTPAAELSEGLYTSSLFDIPDRFTYPWIATYTTEQYLQLQMTQSPNRMLPPERRTRLLEELAAVVDGHGGSLAIHYTTNVFVARRLD